MAKNRSPIVKYCVVRSKQCGDACPRGGASTSGTRWGTPNGRRIDAVLRITAPDGTSVRLILEAKLGVMRGNIPGIVEQLRGHLEDGDIPVLAAKYLNPQVRTDLTKSGVSFIDATGNLMITSQMPAIYLSDRGEDRDPWRGAGRPRGTLKGEPAARVVRTLLDFDRTWRARELINVSRASTGATYRVLEYLQQEGLAERSDDGSVRVPNWRRLLEAWAKDAPFLSVNRVSRHIEPRGPDVFIERIRVTSSAKYTVTGTVAAAQWTAYAPARAVYVYVDSIEEASESWGLRPSEASPNVILVEPKKPDAAAFDRRRESRNGYSIAAPSQVAADLMNGPGRNPSEAEELLAWMQMHEDEWRNR